MTKQEFLSLPEEIILLADRISRKDVSETQLAYIIGTKGFDKNEILRAVEFIERTKTRSLFWFLAFFVLILYFIINSVIGVLFTLFFGA